MHKLIFRTLSLSLTVFGLVFFNSGLASAAKPGPATPTLLGNDISWPQCNKSLPTKQAFGIVGVNDGLANNTNPCLTAQLYWAAQSTGATAQPKTALYVNTANPGLSGSWWPNSNEYGGTTVSSSYGTCDGSDSAACAYVYGYAKAYDDANIRGVSSPSSYTWWLDVETINSWESNKAANAADLEGMTAYFQSIHAQVGLYSTGYQWGKITGSVSANSNLNNLLSWIPGANSQNAAASSCKLSAPLTSGSTVTMTQYISKNLDYDYSCI